MLDPSSCCTVNAKMMQSRSLPVPALAPEHGTGVPTPLPRTPQIASGRPVVRSPRLLHRQVRSDGAMIAIDAALQGRSEMRTVVLGATVALAMSLAGVSGASATPITAAAIDEAVGAVSLMTKTITASSKQFKHHHHHTSQHPTTAPTGGQPAGGQHWVWPWGWIPESPGWQSPGWQPGGWQSPGWQPSGGPPPVAGQRAPGQTAY